MFKRLIGPIFINETVNCEQYLHMFQNNFLLQCMAQALHLLTLWLMQDGAWPHTVNNVLDLFNAVFVPSITSKCYLDHHNCDIFGHLPDLIWIIVTSFCAVSCKRRCCYENHPMKLRWKLSLLSCAQGLMNTHHGVIMKLVRQLQERTQRNGSHTRIKWHIKNLHRCTSNLQEGCRGKTDSIFFIIIFPVNYSCTTLHQTSKFSVELLFVSWFTILGFILWKNMYSQISQWS